MAYTRNLEIRPGGYALTLSRVRSRIAAGVASNVQHMLEQMVDSINAQTLQDHPDTPASQLLAINPNMLPSVHYSENQVSLTLPNPDGATSFFVNLADTDAMARVLALLQDNGGIAPQWLVDTQFEHFEKLVQSEADASASEREVTAGKSGLVERAWSQAAAIQGSAGEAVDFKSQQFGRLIVHAKDAQVQLTEALKNIDHDAYLERTEWVAASDAQGYAQSLLVIDFNADGVIDTRDAQMQADTGKGSAPKRPPAPVGIPSGTIKFIAYMPTWGSLAATCTTAANKSLWSKQA